MSTKLNRIILIISSLALLFSLAIMLHSNDVNDSAVDPEASYGAYSALYDNDLTLEDMLRYAVEDEYLAHGEYVTIINKFDVERPYTNIASSELTHLAMLQELYVTYDIEFPSDTSKEHLVIPDSLLNAANTGVEAEIANINMYETFLNQDIPDDVRAVFEALAKASVNHLTAFTRQIEKLS